MSDRELCEAVVSHFDSHPAQEEDLKTQASEVLKDKKGKIDYVWKSNFI